MLHGISAKFCYCTFLKLPVFCDEILSLRYASFQNDGGGGAVRTDGFVGAKNFGFFVGVDVHGDPKNNGAISVPSTQRITLYAVILEGNFLPDRISSQKVRFF